MEDRKFGVWDFGAKNSERVAHWAQNFIRCESEPSNPWKILHGIDQNSYKKPYVAVTDDEALASKEVSVTEETDAAVFQVPDPVDPIFEKKDVSIHTCLNAPLKHWPQLLPGLPEDDACSLLQELCENSSVVLERHALVATHLILPKLQSEEKVSRKFVFSAIKFVSSFPAPSIRFLLTDLIVQAPANEHHLDHVKELASQVTTPSLQATLLSSVTSTLERLHKSHLPFLLMLIGDEADAKSTNKLVELMAASAAEFSAEIAFGRLIIAVLKLEPANGSALEYIITKHQTLLKGKAAKMLSQMAEKQGQ